MRHHVNQCLGPTVKSTFVFISFHVPFPSSLCQTAGRTLGDLVRKLGERVLPEIIPILEKGLDSERSDERQGVCIGISEIVKSTNRDMVSNVKLVRTEIFQPLVLEYLFSVTNSSFRSCYRTQCSRFIKADTCPPGPSSSVINRQVDFLIDCVID